jgi:hypothetical protein
MLGSHCGVQVYFHSSMVFVVSKVLVWYNFSQYFSFPPAFVPRNGSYICPLRCVTGLASLDFPRTSSEQDKREQA